MRRRAVRSSLDAAVRLSCHLGRNQRVPADPDPSDGLVKVNLGSALNALPGWINVDASLNAFLASWPAAIRKRAFALSHSRTQMDAAEYLERTRRARFVQHDLRRSLPFETGMVDFVYSSHLLEYLSYDDTERLLAEIRRVLRTGGLLRLCVLDFGRVVTEFAPADKKAAFRKVLFNPEAAALAQPRSMYDFALLEDFLERGGFQDIRRCAAGEGSAPNLDLLDNRSHETLYVEARP
jgi:SAM-dependent methyltransferase